MLIIWQPRKPVLIIIVEGRSSVVYVIIKTLIWMSVQTRLQYLSRVVRFFDLSSFELHNLASPSTAARRLFGAATASPMPGVPTSASFWAGL